MGRAIRFLIHEFTGHCQRVVEAWNTFWFTPRDAFALSVIRCLVGWMAFYTTFVWGLELEAFFFPNSYNSAVLISDHFANGEGPYALSFWHYVPVEWMYQVHYLCMAVTFCFMIGLFTRVTSVLSLVILISYAYRARFATYGLDQINILLTMYLCISNCGAYLSIDRLFKRYRLTKKNLLAGRSIRKVPHGPLSSVANNIATRMIQIHFCVIYMAAGLGKLQGDSWWDGTAMWRGLANAEYQTFDMTWLAFFPLLTQLLTHMTIAWEISFSFLVWRPLTKMWVLAIGLSMHFGIGLMLGMWTFGTCMMFGYLAFIEPEQVKSFFRYLRGLLFSSQKQVIEVASSSIRSVSSAARKKAFDVANRLILVVDGVPPDLESADPVEKQTTRSIPAITRLVILDPIGKLYKQYSPSMKNTGIKVTHTKTLDELQSAVEQYPESAVLANLDGFSEIGIRDFVGSILPFALRYQPSLVLLRPHQVAGLNDYMTEDHQRILIQPCTTKDVSDELQRAVMMFNRKFQHENGSPGEATIGLDAVTPLRTRDEAEETVFD